MWIDDEDVADCPLVLTMVPKLLSVSLAALRPGLTVLALRLTLAMVALLFLAHTDAILLSL